MRRERQSTSAARAPLPDKGRSRKKTRVRRDPGRSIARLFCALFALVGLVPLGAFAAVRTEAARAWAASESARLLEESLGLRASFDVRVRALPLAVTLENIAVLDDLGLPFVLAERAQVRPRLFSLLSGHLDAGAIELVGARVRAEFEGGKLKNVTIKAAGSEGSAALPERAPVASIEITDAAIDLVVDGQRVSLREVDVDVSSEGGLVFEAALRAGQARLRAELPEPGRPGEPDAVYEDVLCRFEARARLSPEGALVRRLHAEGSIDFDPEEGTEPSCSLPEGDWRHFELRLGGLRVDLRDKGLPAVRGRVQARLPLPVVHRFVAVAPISGWAGLDVEVDWDGEIPREGSLPTVKGRVSAGSVGIDSRVAVSSLSGEVEIGGDSVELHDVEAGWADGVARIENASLSPFDPELRLEAGPAEISGMRLSGLLRDLAVHSGAHVELPIEEAKIARFGGTLLPLELEGPIEARTGEFEIYDLPHSDPARRRMFGAPEARVRTTFMVRESAVVFSRGVVETPLSRVAATVSIGFDNTIGIQVPEGTRVDLAEVSPLGGVEMRGLATLSAEGAGPTSAPRIFGKVSAKDFAFAGMKVGEVESAVVAFEPLALDFSSVRIRHGGSLLRVPKARVDFDAGADAVATATVDTLEAPHLALSDLLQIFELEKDPRLADLKANLRASARLRFVVGGREDRCGGGMLDVKGGVDLHGATLLGETFDAGRAEFGLVWDDMAAGSEGMRLDVHSASLRKGEGLVVGRAEVRHGGVLRGSAVGTSIPLAKIDALGTAGKLLDGRASLVAELGGTLSRLEARADVELGRIRIGARSLPPSHLEVKLVPEPAEAAVGPDGKKEPKGGRPPAPTACGNAPSRPFDLAEWERDPKRGEILVRGQLAGGQVLVDALSITQQRGKIASGRIRLERLDLGTLANLLPGVAFASEAPEGHVSASIEVARMPTDSPKEAEAALTLRRLELERGGHRVRLVSASGPATLAMGSLEVPELRVEARSASGVSAILALGGKISRVEKDPEVDATIRVLPLDLARLSADVDQIASARGTVEGELRVAGPLLSPRLSGSARLRDGAVALRGGGITIDGAAVDVEIGGGELRVSRASARFGGGTLSAKARMPLRGFEPGTLAGVVRARDVRLPTERGIEATADADLEVTYRPRPSGRAAELLARLKGEDEDEAQGSRALPDVKGTVTLTSFRYTRPIAMSVSLRQLAGMPQRTKVDTYSPGGDYVRFYVNVVSSKPLVLSNNLVDMKLEVASPGLAISGTNQRYGARGSLRVLPESTLTLRTSAFEVREGTVRFDDPFRIAPKVDLRAQTEYRRAASDASAGAAAAAGQGDASGSASSGQWRINLHAQGDAEDLKIRLTSDPALSQDDILLLLTIGMTRAEIDRGLASSLGETVGLEALSALTGADKAVKDFVPLIDEFRFGSGYSSRTGRTEPTITVGKRLASSLRASVTTGLTENREVRSNLEWRIGRRMSIQGSYDSVNDVSNSPLGNIGADLRWRLEFE